MNKLKRIKWEIKEVYGSVSNWAYNRFYRKCRRQAEAIYNYKLDTTITHELPFSFAQGQLMWNEAMDTVINRPINKIILKVLEAWDNK